MTLREIWLKHHTRKLAELRAALEACRLAPYVDEQERAEVQREIESHTRAVAEIESTVT